MADALTRSHKIAVTFVFLVVVVVGGAVLAATLLWIRSGEPYKGYASGETFVDIPQGASTADIRRRLIEAGVVRNDYVFRVAVWAGGHARDLKAGEYRFDAPLSAFAVVDRIARGDVYTRRVTFPEGLTLTEMSRIYESRGLGTARAFLEASRDPSRIKALDPDATDLEGYLFPETYALPRGVQPSRLIDAMVNRFLATFTDEMRQQARVQGLSIRQVVTLASLVEKETAQADEHPLVAAVYRNRMRLAMPMQADPTVIFALEKAGKYTGNIRRDDLLFDSPYNTYRYPGLPPGPIAAPGRAALEAALAPADVPYLFFVSRNDGTHVFARTLAEHNANVHEHQVLFFRRQRLQRGNGARE